MANHKSAIKR